MMVNIMTIEDSRNEDEFVLILPDCSFIFFRGAGLDIYWPKSRDRILSRAIALPRECHASSYTTVECRMSRP